MHACMSVEYIVALGQCLRCSASSHRFIVFGAVNAKLAKKPSVANDQQSNGQLSCSKQFKLFIIVVIIVYVYCCVLSLLKCLSSMCISVASISIIIISAFIASIASQQQRYVCEARERACATKAASGATSRH